MDRQNPCPTLQEETLRTRCPFCRGAFRVEGNTLRLTKAGSVPIRWSRHLPTEASSVTIIKDSAGRSFASFVVEVKPLEPQELPHVAEVGVALGLASLAVTPDGETISPPRFLISARKRPGRLQRNLSPKTKGSNRRNRARHLVAQLHAKRSDRRLDVLHRFSTRLVRENQRICIEDLDVSGMLQNRKLGKSITDAGWRMCRTLLEGKGELYGRILKVVCRWEPSSQTCATCGHREGREDLSVRQWRCPGCGVLHDRDVNAARNILAAVLVEKRQPT